MNVYRDIKLMRKKWPKFRALGRGCRFVTWRGSLRPICQEYTVEVYYRVPRDTNQGFRGPDVTIIEPLLRRRAESPYEPIPHHYRNSARPELPFLCLYDPAASEWEPGLPIATTIIPWTIDWLACYEGWLATGSWTGGGRHPT